MSLTPAGTYNKKDLMFIPWGVVLKNQSGRAIAPIGWNWHLVRSRSLIIGFGRKGKPYLNREWFRMHRMHRI